MKYQLVVLCCAASLLAACSEVVRITSTPSGARAEIWPTGEIITTPGQVTLKRKGTYAVRYRLADYHEESVQVSHATAELGVLVGFHTGAGYRLVPNPVHANLRRLDGATLYPRVFVSMPADVRAEERSAAGTGWQECETDEIYGDAAADFVRGQVAVELTASGLFQKVSMEASTPHELSVHARLVAFCSEVPGILYSRAAGRTVVDISLRRDGRVVFEGRFDDVVTNHDPEYSGEQAAGSLEQARRTAMGDSLRGALRKMLAELRAVGSSHDQGTK